MKGKDEMENVFVQHEELQLVEQTIIFSTTIHE